MCGQPQKDKPQAGKTPAKPQAPAKPAPAPAKPCGPCSMPPAEKPKGK